VSELPLEKCPDCDNGLIVVDGDVVDCPTCGGDGFIGSSDDEDDED
jgi:uncharacterized Zn finger protein (UPF0148 family)